MAGETANGAGFFAAGAPRTDSSTVVGATDSEMYEFLTSFPPPPRRRVGINASQAFVSVKNLRLQPNSRRPESGPVRPYDATRYEGRRYALYVRRPCISPSSGRRPHGGVGRAGRGRSKISSPAAAAAAAAGPGAHHTWHAPQAHSTE